MKIGHLQLSGNLILAPMAGITDLPFRQLCRRFGAGLAISEMVSSDTSLWGSRKTLTRLQHEGETSPIAVQIVGTDPGKLAEAARINVGYGAEIIDINMGCPAKKVCKVAAGSALLRDEQRVGQILEAVVNAIEAPVSLKIRTGWDKNSINATKIAHIAQESGVQMLTIHGRTRACKFTGEAEYETIREVKQQVSIPVVANGDIRDEKKALQVLKFTGADAIMIGRAAQGRPWIFRHIAHYLATGEQMQQPESQWIGDLLLEHLQALYELYGTQHGVRIARKHIAWYSRHLRGAAEFRRHINQVETVQDQHELIKVFFYCRNSREEAA